MLAKTFVLMAAVTATAMAQDAPVPPVPPQQPAGEQRPETVKVPFLGVETSPVDRPFGRRQGTKPGELGLEVHFVAADSPADAAGVQERDVITKLDEQLLVNPHQLQTLIHNKKAGDEVKLTVKRDDKEQVLTVKLGEREVPQMGQFGPGGMPPEAYAAMMGAQQAAQMAQFHAENMLGMGPMGPVAAPEPGVYGPGPRGFGPGPGMYPGMQGGQARRAVTFTDDAMKIEIRREEAVVLTATDKEGKELFKGAIETPEQREALPQPVRERLAGIAVERLVQSFKGDAMRPMRNARDMEQDPRPGPRDDRPGRERGRDRRPDVGNEGGPRGPMGPGGPEGRPGPGGPGGGPGPGGAI